MDVYVAATGKVRLMDFNPVGGFTSPLLFGWDELGYGTNVVSWCLNPLASTWLSLNFACLCEQHLGMHISNMFKYIDMLPKPNTSC